MNDGAVGLAWAGAMLLVSAVLATAAHAKAEPPATAASAARLSARTVLSCQLSRHHKVDLLAMPQGAELITLSTRLRGRTEPAFAQDASGALPAGAMAIRLCMDGLMVYALRQEGWVRGTVLRQRPGTHKLERLEFRDTALPYGLYVNADEMRLVVPARDGAQQYTIYSTRTGQGRPSKMLPSGRLFTFYALQ